MTVAEAQCSSLSQGLFRLLFCFLKVNSVLQYGNICKTFYTHEVFLKHSADFMLLSFYSFSGVYIWNKLSQKRGWNNVPVIFSVNFLGVSLSFISCLNLVFPTDYICWLKNNEMLDFSQKKKNQKHVVSIVKIKCVSILLFRISYLQKKEGNKFPKCTLISLVKLFSVCVYKMNEVLYFRYTG